MPKQQVNRTREKNDPAAFSHKPMLDEDKNTKSQMEGPAAYAPHQGAQGAKKNTRKQCQPDGPLARAQ